VPALGIDLHCHIFPPEYLRLARTDGERVRARIDRFRTAWRLLGAEVGARYVLTEA